MSANVVKGQDLKKHSSLLQRIGLKSSTHSLELIMVEMVAEVELEDVWVPVNVWTCWKIISLTSLRSSLCLSAYIIQQLRGKIWVNIHIPQVGFAWILMVE